MTYMETYHTMNMRLLVFLVTLLSISNASAEEGGWDWDLFDGEGWTPRYAYLSDDNFIGHAHYAGLAYYQKKGAEQSGMSFRYGFGKKGDKVNIAYTNSFSFMAVDFGLSYHFLDDDNRISLDGSELLGLEMGLRFWVIQFIGVHTEETSWVTLAYGF